MPQYKKYQGYAWVAIIMGIAIVIHHVIVSGRLFDMGDILHHEFFAVAVLAFGLGILLLLPKPYRKPPKIQP